MSPKKKQPRNAVSFNQFRRYNLAAFSRIRSLFTSENSTAPTDAQLLAFALERSLVEGRWADAVSLAASLSEQQYGDSLSYRRGAQLVALVKKVPYTDPSLDPEGTALRKFLEAEETCRATNEVLADFRLFFNGLRSDLQLCDDAQRIFTLLARARSHVHRVLGQKPPLGEIWQRCRFGSGASVGTHGAATHLMRKLSSSTWTCSTVAAPFARAALKANQSIWEVLGLYPRGNSPLYRSVDEYTREALKNSSGPYFTDADFDVAFASKLVLCDADQITYVPKQADSHRTVGTQPLLNMVLQLGAGDYLRDDVLLRRCGIDLRRDQEAVNGKLALLGSSCEGLPFATIDLKSASDCLCIELVRFLLPAEWFAFLNSLRTPAYLLPGSNRAQRYQKFCAMGNGFCFPLETLIFWSLVQAVYDVGVTPDRACAVYGDDIIVYQSVALELIELLSCVGFDTNVAKTFVFGPFRESCGQDFYDGVNVRPVVVDEIFRHESQVYHFINSLQRKGYTGLAEHLRELIPGEPLKRPYPGDTSTALEVPLDEFMASRHARFEGTPPDKLEEPWYQSWSWLEFLTTAIRDESEYCEQVQLACALCGAEPNGSGLPVYAYRRKTEVRVRRVAHG